MLKGSLGIITGRRAIGMDVGGRWARMIVLSRDHRGEPVLQGGTCAELPEGASPAETLRRIYRSATRRGAGVRCNLGNASVIVHQVAFPQMDDADLRSAAKLEAAQLIPGMDEMVMDLQVLGVSRNGEKQIQVMIVAAPKEAVLGRSRMLLDADVNVTAVIPDGVALANAAVALGPPGEETVLVMQVDDTTTHLVAVSPVEDALAPIVRQIQGGRDLLVDPAEADAGASNRSRSAQTERWLREVERSIEFAANRLQKPAGRMLVGGGAGNILELLESQLSISVSGWNPLKLLRRGSGAPDVSFVEYYGPHTAVAVGLALTEGV